MQDSWPQLKSDSTSSQKDTEEVSQIHRTSDMLWVYVTTRRQINLPERLDPREHQDWTRVGSHNQLLAR